MSSPEVNFVSPFFPAVVSASPETNHWEELYIQRNSQTPSKMPELHSPDISPTTTSMITINLTDLEIPPQDADPLNAVSRRSSVSSRPTEDSLESDEDTYGPELVDWEGLEKTEELQLLQDGTDESTALLLARLEQENAALAGNPKAGISNTTRHGQRPLSIQHLKMLVSGPQRQSLRYSLLPAPQMTELEFWAALVSDYPQTAQRLPTLTSNKIRGGVPPPLRGVVWPSVARAQDDHLHEEYQRLCTEPSPYEGLIGKDVSRSFPNVDMFRERDGEGQQMLARVLTSFSLYDEGIGYCQGLGFVVGPLLMHMNDAEAFCILVRLMETYDLRSCYLPDLGGLHLRIYQFQTLLSRHLPDLTAHLEELRVEPLYVSQWFLSFFAVTCPLPMLLRIYDVLLAEGATETLMRVALSLMQRNEEKLLGFTEFEDAMQFLLSRGLWDTYAQHADDLVNDFVSLSSLVSRESLQALESGFRETQPVLKTRSLKNTASQILGRFWAGSSHSSTKSTAHLSVTIPATSARISTSRQSLTSASNSLETGSEASTLATETSEPPKQADSIAEEAPRANELIAVNSTDRDLHHQIEELLTVLGEMQRQQIELARELQREREGREEDRDLAKVLLTSLKKQTSAIQELAGGEASAEEVETDRLIRKAASHFVQADVRRVSIVQTKHQLRDAAVEWKEKHENESARCHELMKQLDERENEHFSFKEQLREARLRIQEGHRDKQRLERTIQDLRSRVPPSIETLQDTYSPISENGEFRVPSPRPGLREFKLGKTEQPRSNQGFAKRSSSLSVQNLLQVTTENQEPLGMDALLLELVNAKTSEAVAKQELEETKGRLDALRKIISGPISSPTSRTNTGDLGTPSLSPGTEAQLVKPLPETPLIEVPKSPVPQSSGGFFSGWGKRKAVEGPVAVVQS